MQAVNPPVCPEAKSTSAAFLSAHGPAVSLGQELTDLPERLPYQKKHKEVKEQLRSG